MNPLLKTAIIGSAISLVALVISLLLPVLLGPGVSWDEAKLGYIPAAVAFVGFQLLLYVTAAKSRTSGEGGQPEPAASTGRALANVIAVGVAIAGVVGAGFCAVEFEESWRIGNHQLNQVASMESELTKLQTDGAGDDSEEVLKLQDKILSYDAEEFLADARTFRNWGLASGAAALAAIAWLARAWAAKKRQSAAAVST